MDAKEKQIRENIILQSKSIVGLQKMKDIYESEVDLYRTFASDMLNEIDEQIKFCQESINNLNTELKKFFVK